MRQTQPSRTVIGAATAAAVVTALSGAAGTAGAAAAAGPAGATPGASTTRVSVGPGARQANAASGPLSLSATGRYVAFSSTATNLVARDTNGVSDVFVRDRLTGVTRRVSVGPGGRQADAASTTGQLRASAISANGRWVVFESSASNLVAGDTNGVTDVFLRDLVSGQTSRMSVGRGGRQADEPSSEPVISADGLHVGFSSLAATLVAQDTNRRSDVFVRDRLAGVTRRVSVGGGGRQSNGGSFSPALSRDGRHVAFSSSASNLTTPGDTNGVYDVYVRDRLSGVTRRASVGVGGAQADEESVLPALSADGRYVTFRAWASNLVPDDTNGLPDIVLRDLRAGVTERVSVSTSGEQADGDNVFSSVSADGRYVAFDSSASNLVAGDTNATPDVFLRDRLADVTLRASVGTDGRQADDFSSFATISADGRRVAFTSDATNLVTGDTNGVTDVFVREGFADRGAAVPPATTAP